MSEIKTTQSLEELVKCLDDKNYLVRVKSAKSLSNITKKSRALLTEYEENSQNQFQAIATYFLNIYEMRDK